MLAMINGPRTFHDRLVAQPRPTDLALAPDGTRLILSVQALDETGSRYTSELWEVDPAGEKDPRRVPGSRQGDSAPAFSADGTLLFLADRGSGESGEEPGPSVWSLPERGEAERIAQHPGGTTAFTAAARADALAWTAALLPGAADARTHAELLGRRRRAGVSAVLHEVAPGDDGGELGPAEPHTFVRARDAEPVDAGGQGLEGAADVALSPDGTLVAYTRSPTVAAPDTNTVVMADARTGVRRRTLSRPGHQYYSPVFTADGTSLVCERQREETYDSEWQVTLVAIDPVSGEETDLLPDFENWPWPGRAVCSPVPGDTTLWFTGDEQGHRPVFRRDPDGTVTRLTASGAYTSLCVTPDGSTLYALHSAFDRSPHVVRLDAAKADQHPAPLGTPGGDLGPLPGTLTEVHTTGDDGFPLRGWLVLPEQAAAEHPAPLLVMPHGGPQGSWSDWPWLWNPWPFAARGYAVLLPDPALSSGYGQRMQERGRGEYGGRPYRDVLALTDAAQARTDLDPTRTALAGWSYGGYLANRAATRTDRFKALVSHGGLWNLESFQGGTDMHAYFRKIFGDPRVRRERYDADSPHLDATKLTTPMLVVHGGADTRVPEAQSRELLHDLRRQGVPTGFLYFPDESHGVEAPNHLGLLYETVLAFLDHHVLGEDWRRPALL